MAKQQTMVLGNLMLAATLLPSKEIIHPQDNQMREGVAWSEEQAQAFVTFFDLTAMMERDKMRTQRGSLQFVCDPPYPKHIMSWL